MKNVILLVAFILVIIVSVFERLYEAGALLWLDIVDNYKTLVRECNL